MMPQDLLKPEEDKQIPLIINPFQNPLKGIQVRIGISSIGITESISKLDYNAISKGLETLEVALWSWKSMEKDDKKIRSIDEALHILDTMKTPMTRENATWSGLNIFGNWNDWKSKDYYSRKIRQIKLLVGDIDLSEPTLDSIDSILSYIEGNSSDIQTNRQFCDFCITGVLKYMNELKIREMNLTVRKHTQGKITQMISGIQKLKNSIGKDNEGEIKRRIGDVKAILSDVFTCLYYISQPKITDTLIEGGITHDEEEFEGLKKMMISEEPRLTGLSKEMRENKKDNLRKIMEFLVKNNAISPDNGILKDNIDKGLFDKNHLYQLKKEGLIDSKIREGNAYYYLTAKGQRNIKLKWNS